MRGVNGCLFAIVVAMVAAPSVAFAQVDEIQVYDGGLAPVGVFNLTLHNNYTPSGIKEPAFPGAVTSHKSLNGVPEWALGVTTWFEAGLYMPLYSHDDALGWGIDGVKLRTLFAVPNADDRKFFYGANFEFSYNAKQWDTTRFTSEIRPIVGWHLPNVDIIFNPILDTSYDGFKNLIFAPSFRLSHSVSDVMQLAIEHYADYGPVSDFHAGTDQFHQIYGVVDYAAKWMDIEAGLGFGLTNGSDNCTFKVILSRDLNKKK